MGDLLLLSLSLFSFGNQVQHAYKHVDLAKSRWEFYPLLYITSPTGDGFLRGPLIRLGGFSQGTFPGQLPQTQ